MTLAEGLPWVRQMAQHYAAVWPDVDADELEGRLVELWAKTGRRPRARWVAMDLLTHTVRRRQREEQGFAPNRELPEPPADRSRLSIDAYVLECLALGARHKDIDYALEKAPGYVSNRLPLIKRGRPTRRWNWAGERVRVRV